MTHNTTDPIRRTGKIMFAIVWILILLFFYFLSDSWFSKKRNPNQIPNTHHLPNGIKEVHLQQSLNKTYILNGTINLLPITFMVDTGASSVAIPIELAKKLNLPKGRPVTVHTASGTLSGYISQVQEITLGNIILKNIQVVVSSYAQPHIVLLGMSALKHLDFEKRNSILILRQKNTS